MGIVKASLEILGIGIGVKKVVLLRSGSQSNLKPFPASKMLAKCLNQQDMPKNVMLGTKDIEIGPLGPKLAQTQYTVGKTALIR